MEVEQETPATVHQLRETLEDYLFKETNKANKTCMSFVLRLWRKMEKISNDNIVERAEAVAENKILKAILKEKDAELRKTRCV